LSQNIRDKNRTCEELPNLWSGNKFYKPLKMKKITGSVFSMTNKKIDKFSHLNCVGKCSLPQNIDNETTGYYII
jgi:hypothetical protein